MQNGSGSDPQGAMEAVAAAAAACGFDRWGVADLARDASGDRLRAWLDRGYHGEMAWMARDAARRADPALARPWARRAIVVAVDYHTDHPLSVEVPDTEGAGWISRYAWGDDYHRVLERRLAALERALLAAPGFEGARFHRYVDHGPLLERELGRRAGLGWVGKNAMLIHPAAGSFFFLGVLLVDVDLPVGAPTPDRCGSCTACLDACPTDAFVAPRVLDARRCISYVTIEAGPEADASTGGHGPAASGPRPPVDVGFHVFGCDLCQDVCPWNRRAPVVTEPAFQPRPGFVHPRLDALRGAIEAGEGQGLARSPLKRRKVPGLLANLARAGARGGEPNFHGAAAARSRWRPPRARR